MINYSINCLAVLVASLASFLLGWVWYCPLFGKLWSKENKVKMQKKPEPIKLLYNFILTVAMVIFF